jgi:hypothetical protein
MFLYLNDYQQKRVLPIRIFYAFGTIDLLEENTINSITILKQILQFKKNTTKNYFKNSLSFNFGIVSGNIVLNNEGLKQELSNEYFRFSNNLKSIFIRKTKACIFFILRIKQNSTRTARKSRTV